MGKPTKEKSKIRRVVLSRPAEGFCQRIGDPKVSIHPRVGPTSDVFLEVLGYREQRLATYSFRHLMPKADDLVRILEERNYLPVPASSTS